MDLETVAGELYGLRPEEFTAARDERARQARSDGERDVAGQIRGLRKPTMGAWVVNLLVRERTEDVDRLLELGEQLRTAQRDLQGEELRTLSRQRTQVVSALARQGRRLAADVGHPVSEAVEREVEATLEAALADPDAAAVVRSGRLAKTLSYSGFGAVDVSGAVAVPSRKPSTERPRREQAATREDRAAREREQREQAREQAQRELAEAEDAARQSQYDTEEARREEDAARTRRDTADENVTRLKAELDQAESESAEAARALQRATRRAERANRDVAAARRRVEQSQARLDRFRE